MASKILITTSDDNPKVTTMQGKPGEMKVTKSPSNSNPTPKPETEDNTNRVTNQVSPYLDTHEQLIAWGQTHPLELKDGTYDKRNFSYHRVFKDNKHGHFYYLQKRPKSKRVK